MAGNPFLTCTEMTTELERHTGEPNDGHPLWASRFLVTNKEAVVSTYRKLIQAGAGMIHTNTYQAYPGGFVKHMGLTDEESVEVFKESVVLCQRAVLEEDRPDVQIAGSVGSINALRADGSEYSGENTIGITEEQYIFIQKPRVQALYDGGIRFFAFETLPCSAEALALIKLIKQYPGVKAWISFYARNGSELSNGEKFADAAVKCWEEGRDQLVAVGVNCLDPAWVEPLFNSLKAADPSVPFIAYPNSGERYDTVKKTWAPCDTELKVVEYMPIWLDMGIAYVGGCCRNYPEDLRNMKEAIHLWKQSKHEK